MRRRIGYAEREGEAILRRQRKAQRRKETIGLCIAIGLSFAFFWTCYVLWVTGNTPIFK